MFFAFRQSWEAHTPVESKFRQFLRSHRVSGGACFATGLPNGKKTSVREILVWLSWYRTVPLQSQTPQFQTEEDYRWKLKSMWHLITLRRGQTVKRHYRPLVSVLLESRAGSKVTGWFWLQQLQFAFSDSWTYRTCRNFCTCTACDLSYCVALAEVTHKLHVA